jgi:hypothetical protein
MAERVTLALIPHFYVANELYGICIYRTLYDSFIMLGD